MPVDPANSSSRVELTIREALPFCRADGRAQVLPGPGNILKDWSNIEGGLTSHSPDWWRQEGAFWKQTQVECTDISEPNDEAGVIRGRAPQTQILWP